MALQLEDAPVLIVGAGPTGLLLAVELRRRGVAANVIDKHRAPLAWDRATIMQPRAAEIFADLSRDRHAAAGKLLGQLEAGLAPKGVIDTARRFIFLKGSNSHDYKFSSAVLEDFYQVSPAWRNRYLAASLFNLRGSGHRDNALVNRARAALT